MIASTVAGSRSPLSRRRDSIASTRTAGSSSCACMLRLRLEVALEHVDMDRDGRVRALAPELACIEANGIDVLRLLAAAMRVRVGEDPRRMDPRHDPALPAHVPGQAGVPRPMDVPRDDALA